MVATLSAQRNAAAVIWLPVILLPTLDSIFLSFLQEPSSVLNQPVPGIRSDGWGVCALRQAGCLEVEMSVLSTQLEG